MKKKSLLIATSVCLLGSLVSCNTDITSLSIPDSISLPASSSEVVSSAAGSSSEVASSSSSEDQTAAKVDALKKAYADGTVKLPHKQIMSNITEITGGVNIADLSGNGLAYLLDLDEGTSMEAQAEFQMAITSYVSETDEAYKYKAGASIDGQLNGTFTEHYENLLQPKSEIPETLDDIVNFDGKVNGKAELSDKGYYDFYAGMTTSFGAKEDIDPEENKTSEIKKLGYFDQTIGALLDKYEVEVGTGFADLAIPAFDFEDIVPTLTTAFTSVLSKVTGVDIEELAKYIGIAEGFFVAEPFKTYSNGVITLGTAISFNKEVIDQVIPMLPSYIGGLVQEKLGGEGYSYVCDKFDVTLPTSPIYVAGVDFDENTYLPISTLNMLTLSGLKVEGNVVETYVKPAEAQLVLDDSETPTDEPVVKDYDLNIDIPNINLMVATDTTYGEIGQNVVVMTDEEKANCVAEGDNVTEGVDNLIAQVEEKINQILHPEIDEPKKLIK